MEKTKPKNDMHKSKKLESSHFEPEYMLLKKPKTNMNFWEMTWVFFAKCIFSQVPTMF